MSVPSPGRSYSGDAKHVPDESREAAAHLGVTPATVLRWLQTGAIPGHRNIRGCWRLDPDDAGTARDAAVRMGAHKGWADPDGIRRMSDRAMPFGPTWLDN